MSIQKIRLQLVIAGLILSVVSLSALSLPSSATRGVNNAVIHFRINSKKFAESTIHLQQTITQIEPNDLKTIIKAREALRLTRYRYKTIEYFLNYFFKSSAHIYNAPAKYEVEEPELEYQEPIGLQVIEDLLYKKITPDKKKELLSQAEAISTSSLDINSLLYNFDANDKQLLESIQLELISIMTLGITGYDAPYLKSGITESYYSLNTIKSTLAPFMAAGRQDEKVSRLLTTAIIYLKTHPDFDSFNRLQFLTDYVLPLQHQLSLLIKEQKLELNTTGIINYNAKNLFDKSFLNVDSIGRNKVTANRQLIALGKQLFFEKGLSRTNTRNCASCHKAEKYFTDGLPKSIALNGHSILKRNAPTLLYAAYQFNQDWDGRVNSLEEQVINVMRNEDEMNADTIAVIAKLKNDALYIKRFNIAFENTSANTISINKLSKAIAAYVRTLAPMNSAFDQYIAGNRKAMTNAQIRGFNLFMGKAQCGTCHFAPIFNGLVPPLYQTTEYEILGTPKNQNLNHPIADDDQGRYNLFPIRFYAGAFKTSTIRNAAKTAPYMHNGSLKSLKNVLDFYNKGGGAGIGLNVPEQTLSAKPLKLNNIEIKEIISFLGSVTDKRF